MQTMKILVDADACPRSALAICRQLGEEYRVPLWTVASFNHNIISDHHVVVGNGDQETDIRVINLTEKGDVVVSQDWGLAALALGKGAKAVSPVGRIFNLETIPFLLEEREAKSKFRRGGGRTKGPKKRSAADDCHFERSLRNLLESDD